MAKKIIVFKINEFPKLSETFIIAQIITAVNLGYEVKILVNKLLDIDESTHGEILEDYSLLDKIIVENYSIPTNKILRILKGIKLFFIYFFDFYEIVNYYRINTKFSLTTLYQWVFYKKIENTSLFHVQYGTSSTVLTKLKKSGYKPSLIVTFHGHDAFFPINGFIHNNGYYDDLFNFATLITVNTPYLANKIKELGCPDELISIVPVAVNTDFFYMKSNKQYNRIPLKLITVGRLDKIKGHYYCIEVINYLLKKGEDVSLTIIGEGKELLNLEKQIDAYGLKEKVFLKGKKSQVDVRQALWEHDIYLLTAIPLSDGRRETQGLATLEAQACGLPAMVFDSGGVKYTVEDGFSGFVFNEFDVVGIADKINFLDKDRVRLFEMSVQAITFINDHFSQKIIDQKWKLLYNKLSNGK